MRPFFPARCAATRRELAAIVRLGLVPPLEGKKELSTTYKFASPWARLFGSRTLLSGFNPKRQVPQTCASIWLFSACLIRMNRYGLRSCAIKARNIWIRARPRGRILYLIPIRAPGCEPLEAEIGLTRLSAY